MYEIVAPNAVKIGSRHYRILPGKPFGRLPDGQWEWLRALVVLAWDPVQSKFTANCGGEYIRMIPRSFNLAAVQDYSLDWANLSFGWTVDRAAVGTSLVFDVETSPGVYYEKGRWSFPLAAGWAGLDLSAWQSKFPGKLAIGADRVTIDIGASLSATLDLDPDVAESDNQQMLSDTRGDGDTTWDGSNGWPAATYIKADHTIGSHTYYRGATRYDTSGYPSISAATLWAKETLGSQDLTNLDISICTFGAGTLNSDSGNYGDVYTGYTTNRVTALAQAQADDWWTWDLTADYLSQAQFDIGWSHVSDRLNAEAAGEVCIPAGVPSKGDDNRPYLVITETGATGTMVYPCIAVNPGLNNGMGG